MGKVGVAAKVANVEGSTGVVGKGSTTVGVVAFGMEGWTGNVGSKGSCVEGCVGNTGMRDVVGCVWLLEGWRR